MMRLPAASAAVQRSGCHPGSVDHAQVTACAAQLMGVPIAGVAGAAASLRSGDPSREARVFRCRLEPDVWRGISIAARGQPRTTALLLVDLARALLALDPGARERTRAYARRWKGCAADDLRERLARFDEVAEAALYLASFKPRGLIVTPPFGLAAELLLRAHGHQPVEDTALLDWFEGGQ